MDIALIEGQKKNNLITGRGSTAIYLSLCNEGFKEADVIVPGNICYAAVYPIICSNNNVVFCDVDRQSGNVTLDIIRDYRTKNTKAIIVPHMYGNSVNDLLKIKKWCEENNIVLIEDCASSLGSSNNEYGLCGHLGDYVIYSFGYSKIVDIGKGGMLSSDRNLDKAKLLLSGFCYLDRKIEEKEKEFSARYRIARYSTNMYDDVKCLFNEDLFINKLEQNRLSELIDNRLINESINKHLNNYRLYDGLLDNCLERYEYNEGSVPWRFSLLITKRIKSEIIKVLLKKRLPVSDWYPNVTVLFEDVKMTLSNVDLMEEEIVNFPLDIEEDIIKEICFHINSIER